MDYGEEIEITDRTLRKTDKWLEQRMKQIRRICELNILLGLPLWDGFLKEWDINRFKWFQEDNTK